MNLNIQSRIGHVLLSLMSIVADVAALLFIVLIIGTIWFALTTLWAIVSGLGAFFFVIVCPIAIVLNFLFSIIRALMVNKETKPLIVEIMDNC